MEGPQNYKIRSHDPFMTPCDLILHFFSIPPVKSACLDRKFLASTICKICRNAKSCHVTPWLPLAIFTASSVKVKRPLVASKNLTDTAITWKLCKIGGKLVLITNRKSYMSFRLVPKSVTLNDLERRNGCVVCIISRNSVGFGAYYIQVRQLLQPNRPFSVFESPLGG